MNRLNELNQLLDDKFNPNWIDELINNDDNLDNFKISLKEKEVDLIPNVYQLLNYSIIEGEYIKNPEEFSKIISIILSKISSFQNNLTYPNLEYSSIIIEYQLFYSIKKAIDLYKRIANKISALIYNPEKTYIGEFSSTPLFEGYTEYFTLKNNEVEKALFDLLFENLSIAETGFFLDDDDGQFFNLLNKINELKSIKTKISDQGIIDVLIEICVFYQRKIIIRKYQDEEKFYHKYIFEQNETDFILEKHKLQKKEFLDKWDYYSQNHYLSEKNQERKIILKRNAEDNSKSIEPRNFFINHSLIKFYKDIDSTRERIEKIAEIQIFFSEYNSNSKFDDFAKHISIGYVLNNHLSKKLENLQIKDLKNEIEDINKHQENCNINNYFPYYKICKYLKKSIEIEFEELKKGEKENFEEIKDQISQLKNTFQFFRKKLKWSKNHLRYAYQLPFDECIAKTKIDDDEISVFIPSTFLLPLNYDKYDGYSKKLNNFLLFCENELKSLENYYYLNRKILEKEKEISEVLKDQSKKNIELLGIFSAIIALLFQGAYTVNTDKISYEDKLFTLIAMFIILISFLLMLRSFYSKKFERDELITIRIVSFLIIPLLLFATIILFKIFI